MQLKLKHQKQYIVPCISLKIDYMWVSAVEPRFIEPLYNKFFGAV